MSVGFGFSAGDFIAALKLVGTVIDALRSADGASGVYRELINELYTLESALLRVKRVELEETQNAEAVALRQAASQCQRTIDRFWKKIEIYQQPLRAEGSGSRVKDGWMKVKWAVCKKEDIAAFKADLRGHTGSIEILLMTVQMENTLLQGKKQDRQHRTLAGRIEDASVQWMGRLAVITKSIASSVQQGKQLLEMTASIMRTNVKVFQIVYDLQNIITRVPVQVELQQPVYLMDALGKSAHIHLDFIRSTAAFKAVLTQNFSVVESGPRKIEKGEFAIQETSSKRLIDLSRDWDSCFMPGQRVDMSMIFIRPDNPCSSCPSCKTTCESLEDEDVECSNCGLNFRRIIEADNAIDAGPTVTQTIGNYKGLPATMPRPPKRKRSGDYDEEVKHYRRIRVVGRRPEILRESRAHTLRVFKSPEGSAESALLEPEEPLTIKCICGFDDDDGNTVLCESCNTWQHIECYYHLIQIADDHNCVDCVARYIDRKQAARRQMFRRGQHSIARWLNVDGVLEQGNERHEDRGNHIAVPPLLAKEEERKLQFSEATSEFDFYEDAMSIPNTPGVWPTTKLDETMSSRFPRMTASFKGPCERIGRKPRRLSGMKVLKTYPFTVLCFSAKMRNHAV